MDGHAVVDEIARLAEAIVARGQRPALVEMGHLQYAALRTLYGREFSVVRVRYEQPVGAASAARPVWRTLSELTLRVVRVARSDHLRASTL